MLRECGEPQHDADFTVRFRQQAGQLQDALARHDDLMAIRLADIGFHRTHGQTVSIGGYGTDDPGRHFEQHTVEVVAYVLLRHGEAGALDQTTQLALLQVTGQRTWAFFNRREVIGRQGRQREAATSGLDHQLLVIKLDVDQRIVGQTFADIHQLARRYGDFAGLSRLFQLYATYQLDFQVSTGQRQLLAFDNQEHVGQYRQGLAAFNDACDQLQGFQQGFALNGEMHGLVPCLNKLRWCHQVVSVRSRFL